ncbi:2-hydroxyisoflavanone dehydratase [Medicago truncatula]|uniref:2-hydroxyisoflavanone dehydratase n=2 Tax=Medicago truncatula TaxID=3880 RepID=A0A072UW70_MEDTR|nr:2-hydroxyisoflavanone dehydratase [Medicago truncatula]KEH33676.1 2-hydroxyisoflavanone dehydratase [Medicago truncatula]
MASKTQTTPETVAKEIVTEFGTFIRIFSDGSVERPSQSPLVPPSLNDPNTGLSSKDIEIPHNPTISSRIYLLKITNPPSKFPILVYFHGGAFIFESAFSKLYHDHLKIFASQANVIVVSIEYRLAPEYPLPTCYHDCWAALKWVSSHSNHTNDTINNAEPWLIEHGDFDKVFIGGDSAGANIAHNIAIQAGIEKLPYDVKILGAILIHPYFHSSNPIGSEPIIEPENNLFHKVWHLVYPNAPFGIDNPRVNPLGEGAPSLEKLGCSRIIVCVAGQDRLRDRGVWYWECVKNSGWNGKLEFFEEKDENHVYHLFKPESECAKILIQRLDNFVQE